MLEPVTPVFLAPGAQRREAREQVSAQGDVIVPLDEESVRRAAAELVADGAQAIAVCYLFSFLHPAHEQRTRELIEAAHPGIAVSLSSEVDPTFREYERTVVTAFDAYMKPVVGRYLERLETGSARGAGRGPIADHAVARRPCRHFGCAQAAGAAVPVRPGGRRDRRRHRRTFVGLSRPDHHRRRRHIQRHRTGGRRRTGDPRARQHRRVSGARADGRCERDRRRRRLHRLARRRRRTARRPAFRRLRAWSRLLRSWRRRGDRHRRIRRAGLARSRLFRRRFGCARSGTVARRDRTAHRAAARSVGGGRRTRHPSRGERTDGRRHSAGLDPSRLRSAPVHAGRSRRRRADPCYRACRRTRHRATC